MMTIRLHVLIIIACLSGINSLSFGQETASPQKVSWDTLLDVEWIIDGSNYEVKFNDRAKKLDGKYIEIEGFIFPLEMDMVEMKKFLLSANPLAGCPYCAPGSSESFIMVDSKDKVRFKYDAITITGKFKLTRQGQYGIIYEMTDVRVK